MRRYLCTYLIFCVVCLIAGIGLAADAGSTVTLLPGEGTVAPAFQVTRDSGDVLTLEMELPGLVRSDFEVEGDTYQQLSILGGGYFGAEGEPSLPKLTRLIAVPEGKGVQARIVATEVKTLSGYKLLPLQPDDSKSFVLDADYYKRQGFGDTPLLTVGEPAIMRDIRVVPVIFNPVRYDPATGQVEVTCKQTVEITFTGSDSRNARPMEHDFIVESFDTMYRNMIVNYDSSKGAVGPGSFLYICPDNASVISGLTSLLDWRRRQGYNVVLATTSETGTSRTAIKSYIQTACNTYSTPLEFVCLVGDATGSYVIPTWTESVSGYGGEGDHEYTKLDGTDNLPDIHIGRISIRDITDLNTIVNKVVNYETDPWLTNDPGWFSRAALAGDPSSSGESCIHVNQWVKHQLLGLGYADIDTVWSSSGSTMLSKFARGGTLLTYRGYYGMSGISTGDLESLGNGEKLPFAVITTCDTGSFASDTNCRTEAIVRSSSGGAMASIGMATLGTHTRENNCFFQGIIDGVLNSGDFRVGPALSYGKVEMYNNYQDNSPNSVTIWCTWNTLIGDPGCEMYTSAPKDLNVSYPASLAVGAAGVTVTVEGNGSIPIPGTKVALYKDGEILQTGYTDASGTVALPLDSHTAGTLHVTAMKHNFVPHQGTITLGSVTSHVAYTNHALDDDSSGQSYGNGDGLVNPGETFELAVQVTNLGSSTAYATTGILTCSDPYINVVTENRSFGDIGSGSSVWSSGDYVFALGGSAPAGHTFLLQLETASGGNTWTNVIEMTAAGAAFTAEGYTFTGAGGSLDPGETGDLSIEVRNGGSEAISGANAYLYSQSPWVDVSDGSGLYGSIAVGGTGENLGDRFTISIDSGCFQGHLATFQMIMDFTDGASDTVIFQTTVGSASSDDPVGPDNYGYYAFDNSDVTYDSAPIYNWVEIAPGSGGSGTSVGLTDFGYEQDDTRIVNLPFDFPFYGKNYDKISVCSNGWLAMGGTYLKHWYNKTLPCAGGPDAMIAAFWDDLYISGGVYYWYDASNHRFVVQWDDCRVRTTNSYNTFEVILYDPAYHGTATGDGRIVCQYQTVNNNDSSDGYATVGIQNDDRSDGLLYTYWADYAAGAAILNGTRAIAFETYALQPHGTLAGDVTNATGGGTPIEGVTIEVMEASRTLYTAQNGFYSGSVPVGQFTVIASHESFAPDTVTSVTIVEDGTTVLDFSLDDILGPYILNTTQHPHTDDTVGPYVIQTNITDLSGVSDVHFYYTSSTSGGPHEVTLTSIDPPTGLYEAEIPGQATGSIVQYWVTAVDVAANESAAPSGAPFSTYSFYVGGVVTIFGDDFESNQGWTVGDTGDDASSGIWERVDPNGVFDGATEIQPEDDATPDPGVNCYITGNDPPGSSQGTEDVDGGKTTLLSPWFDLTGYSSVTVQYKRWYSNDTGYAPGEDYWIVEVTDDNVQWERLENTQTSQRSWETFNFSLSDHIDLTSTVRFRFIASDEGSGSVVEAGVDDFSLTGFLFSGEDTESPTVSVTDPNGGEAIQGGSGHVYTIEWDADDNFGVVLTHIILSTDSGVSWPDTLVSGALNGSWTWDVPSASEPNCRIKVVCLDAAANPGEDSSDGDFTIDNLSAVEGAPPVRLSLAQNQPNPFNPRTKIQFAVPRDQDISLRIYDVEGRLVDTLAQGFHAAGTYTVIWDGTNGRGARVSSGLYFYSLNTGKQSLTQKMLLLK
ncbi:MAG: C25 family cysteine peptidase [bacterium]